MQTKINVLIKVHSYGISRKKVFHFDILTDFL